MAANETASALAAAADMAQHGFAATPGNASVATATWIEPSMSSGGNFENHAIGESYFSILKKELIR